MAFTRESRTRQFAEVTMFIFLLVVTTIAVNCRAVADESDLDNRILKTIAKIRYPDRGDSRTVNLQDLGKHGTKSVRLIGRVLALPEEIVTRHDVLYLAAILSALASKGGNTPSILRPYLVFRDGMLVLDPSLAGHEVKRQDWTKWASEAFSTQLRQTWPVLSEDKLCEFLFSEETVEAGNILSKKKLNTDVLKKIAKGIKDTIQAPSVSSNFKSASIVLASNGDVGQKLLTELLSKLPEDHRESAITELIRAGNKECINKALDELRGEKWRTACEVIASARSDNATARLYLFAQEHKRCDILSYLLNSWSIICETDDFTPAIQAILGSEIEGKMKEQLFGVITSNILELKPELASKAVRSKSQVAVRLSKAEWFTLKVRTYLDNKIEMGITKVEKEKRKICIEFKNKSDKTLWINTAALWQAGESIKGQAIAPNGNWEARGKFTKTGTMIPPYEFYPLEQDLAEVKPHSSVKVEYILRSLSNKTPFKGSLTITYTNSLTKYFSSDNEKQSLKSEKKVFQGFLTATVTIP